MMRLLAGGLLRGWRKEIPMGKEIPVSGPYPMRSSIRPRGWAPVAVSRTTVALVALSLLVGHPLAFAANPNPGAKPALATYKGLTIKTKFSSLIGKQPRVTDRVMNSKISRAAILPCSSAKSARDQLDACSNNCKARARSPVVAGDSERYGCTLDMTVEDCFENIARRRINECSQQNCLDELQAYNSAGESCNNLCAPKRAAATGHAAAFERRIHDWISLSSATLGKSGVTIPSEGDRMARELTRFFYAVLDPVPDLPTLRRKAEEQDGDCKKAHDLVARFTNQFFRMMNEQQYSVANVRCESQINQTRTDLFARKRAAEAAQEQLHEVYSEFTKPGCLL